MVATNALKTASKVTAHDLQELTQELKLRDPNTLSPEETITMTVGTILENVERISKSVDNIAAIQVKMVANQTKMYDMLTSLADITADLVRERPAVQEQPTIKT